MGYGMFHGKWQKANVQLFKENGIEMDFEKRGFYEGEIFDVSLEPPKKCFKDRWMYLLHGGYYGRLSFLEYLAELKHPRTFFHIMKRRLIYFFTNKRFL